MIIGLLTLLSLGAEAKPADMDVACDEARVLFTSPGNLQAGVPRDVQPAVALSDGCSMSSQYDLTLRDSSGVEVASESFETRYDHPGELFEMTLEDLSANSEYSLEVLGADGWGELSVISFTTGESAVAGLEGAPQVEIITAIVEDHGVESGGGMAHVAFEVNVAADSDGLSIVEVFDAANPEYPVARFHGDELAADPEQSAYWYLEGSFPEEICVSVEQRDGLGQRVASAESSCHALEVVPVAHGRKTICSVSSVAGLGWFGTLLAMAGIRRRSHLV